MDIFQSYSWIIWLGLILVFAVIEVATVAFWFLMLAVGSLVGLIVGLFGAPFWLQLIAAAVVALLLILAVRPPLFRLLKRGGDRARTGIDALSAMSGTITNDYDGKAGTVKLANGETWTVRLADSTNPPLSAGDHVIVTEINGATAYVAPAERNAH